MAPRAVYFVAVAYIAAGVATADDPPVPDTSGGELLLLEFAGHRAAVCGYKHHLRPQAAPPGLRFSLLQRAGDGAATDRLFCTLQGDDGDLQRLADDNRLPVRRDSLTDGEPSLLLGRVHCALQPTSPVPAGLFDFRATRLSSGLPPFLCLHLDAGRRLPTPLAESAAPPESGALVFRLSRGSVPDLVCRSFSDVPLEESDIEVEVFGFLHPASGPLNCHFRRVYEGQSAAAELLARLSRQMRAQLVSRPGLPAKLSLPSFACDAARRADQPPVPPAGDSSSLPSPSAFTVTGPSGRWAPCSTTLQ